MRRRPSKNSGCRRAGADLRSASARETKLIRVGSALDQSSAHDCAAVACVGTQYALLLPPRLRPNSSPAVSIGVPVERTSVARSARTCRRRASMTSLS